jgi:uncharacterized RDD family membrane protein YckC
MSDVSRYSVSEETRRRELAGVELAPVWRRGLALVADFLIAAFLFVLLVSGGAFLLERVSFLHPDRDVMFRFTFFDNWYSAIWLVMYFAGWVFLSNGRTPGKWLFGVRIVSLKSERLGLWQAVERALGYGASTIELGLGFLQAKWNTNRIATHDRIAETIVVRERRKSASG